MPPLLDLAKTSLRQLLSALGESEEATSGGTGFVVSSAGYVLTNYHVIEEDCGSITTRINGEDQPLTLLASDPANDLAILKLPKPRDHFARFRDRDVRLAESISVAGFPLRDMLSSTIHITTGLVSNLAGMYDNTSSFQITAAVQPGNSGGPVLDRAGRVVGVVVSGLNAEEMLQETGRIPQNVNFAIKTSVVRSFLEANSIEFSLASSTVARETDEIAADASLYTLALTCWE